MHVKKAWQSKTNWTALLIAILGVIPGASELVEKYPQATLEIVALLIMVLRKVTHAKIE